MSQIQASPPPLLSFDHFITHWATDRPERLALREDDRTLTFSELEERTAKVASALIAAGLRKGDRIAWLGKNSDLYYQLFFGAARIGVVMVPVGWRLAPAEIAYIVNDTQARLLFVGPGFDAAVDAIRGDLTHVERILGADAARRWIDASPRGPFSAADAEDAVLQLYTSGTTGNPKGAVLSNRNLFGLRIPSLEADLPWSHWDDDEVVLMCMPCAHIGGTGLGVMALAAGVAGHIMAEFEPGGVLDAVANGGGDTLFHGSRCTPDGHQPSESRNNGFFAPEIHHLRGSPYSARAAARMHQGFWRAIPSGLWHDGDNRDGCHASA